MFYEGLWQVSSGLKEDEKGSKGVKSQRGCPNCVFGIPRSPAPKPALVPASRLYFDINICSMKVCGKFRQD